MLIAKLSSTACKIQKGLKFKKIFTDGVNRSFDYSCTEVPKEILRKWKLIELFVMILMPVLLKTLLIWNSGFLFNIEYNTSTLRKNESS